MSTVALNIPESSTKEPEICSSKTGPLSGVFQNDRFQNGVPQNNWFSNQRRKVLLWLTSLLVLLFVACIAALSFGPAGWNLGLSIAWFMPQEGLLVDTFKHWGVWHDFNSLQLNIFI